MIVSGRLTKLVVFSGNFGIRDLIMGQGAVPILRDGIVDGACGVGGGTAQQDEDCARAGAAKL